MDTKSYTIDLIQCNNTIFTSDILTAFFNGAAISVNSYAKTISFWENKAMAVLGDDSSATIGVAPKHAPGGTKCGVRIIYASLNASLGITENEFADVCIRFFGGVRSH